MKTTGQLRFGITLGLLALAGVWVARIMPEPVDPASQAVLRGATMGTTWELKVTGLDPESEQVLTLQEAIDTLLVELNQAMSTWIPNSEISRFNAQTSTNRVVISSDFRQVVARALDISFWMKGAFDPTLDPLINLWGFGHREPGDMPSSEAVAAARSQVGVQHVSLNDQGLAKFNPDLHLNLSAIAKGFGVDRVSILLAEQGYTNTYVEIGGEVVCRGVNAIGLPWRIGVQTPNPGSGESALKVVALENRALATSGDYRNVREVDGVWLNHILDPSTGHPVGHQLASVSVLAPDCMTADAVATGLMVMGMEQGLIWVEAQPNLEALFIERSGDGFRIGLTPGFDRALVTLP